MVTQPHDPGAAAAPVDENDTRPPMGALWSALSEVSDPEIPVLSILELGMVRELFWDERDPALLIVRITPTYSGCPATDVIADAAREALERAGALYVRVDTVLSPAWSTAWITPEGERKLRAYGIAPPHSGVAPDPNRPVAIDVSGLRPLRAPKIVVPCPRCGSSDTELVATFGSTACKAQYRCRECREPFDYFKSLE